VFCDNWPEIEGKDRGHRTLVKVRRRRGGGGGEVVVTGVGCKVMVKM
jgi:hypothetical protein